MHLQNDVGTSHTVDEWLGIIGDHIRRTRLAQNLTQNEVADTGGISRTALKNLEHGQGASLRTMVQVIRVLGGESWFHQLNPEPVINPMLLMMDGRKRQRARK